VVAEELRGLADEVQLLLAGGAASGASSPGLRRRAKALRRLATSAPALARLADAAEAASDARTLLDLLVVLRQARGALLSAGAGASGTLAPVEDGRRWPPPLPAAELLSLLQTLAKTPQKGGRLLGEALGPEALPDLRLAVAAAGAALRAYSCREPRVARNELPAWVRALTPELEAGLGAGRSGAEDRLSVLCQADRAAGLRGCRRVLAEGDADARRGALRWLPAVADPASMLELALPFLLGEDDNLRREADHALGAAGPKAVPALMAQLQEPPPERSERVASGLLGMWWVRWRHPREALHAAFRPYLPLMLDLLPRSTPWGLYCLLCMIEYLAPPAAEVAPLLFALLDRFASDRKEDVKRREYLLSALGKIGLPSEADLERVGAIARRDKATRWSAIHCLAAAAQTYPRAVDLLLEFLDYRLDLNYSAGQVLGDLRHKAKPALPRLIELVQGRNVARKVGALEAVARMRGAALAAGPAVVAAARDPDKDVRQKALYALRELGPKVEGALAAAREALDDPEKEVRHWAVQSLIGLLNPSEEARQVVRVMLRHADPEVRRFGLYRLTDTGLELPDVLATLEKELRDRDPKHRRAVVGALRYIRPRTAATVPLLRRALDDGDNDVRQGAAEALGELGRAARAALPRLRELANDASWGVRYYASSAQRKIEWALKGGGSRKA
jgi:HEAT repeat protein